VITTLVQLIFNGNNAGDQCRANFYIPDVMYVFIEFLLTPDMRKFLNDTYTDEQVQAWISTLFTIVPGLANQLVALCPPIVNSVVGSSYVSNVGYAEMRGLDVMLFVETFDMGAKHDQRYAAG